QIEEGLCRYVVVDENVELRGRRGIEETRDDRGRAAAREAVDGPIQCRKCRRIDQPSDAECGMYRSDEQKPASQLDVERGAEKRQEPRARVADRGEIENAVEPMVGQERQIFLIIFEEGRGISRAQQKIPGDHREESRKGGKRKRPREPADQGIEAAEDRKIDLPPTRGRTARRDEREAALDRRPILEHRRAVDAVKCYRDGGGR